MTAHSKRRLESKQKECKRCDLHKKCFRSNKIDGRGSENPTWMFVGQNPSRDDDRIGRVFSGADGTLLTETIRDAGFPEGSVRLTNAVRCWSGDKGAAPENEHILACKKYLLDEIEKYKPKVVIILGNVALKAISGRGGITKARGVVWEFDGIFYLPTFHPNALISDISKRESVAKDLLLAIELVESGIPAPPPSNYDIAESFDEAMDMIKWLETFEDSLSTDVETHGNKKTKRGYGADPFAKDAKVITQAWCYKPGHVKCMPLLHKDAPFSREKGLKLLDRISLMNRRRNRWGLKSEAYNAPFDLMFPYVAHGVSFFALDFDGYTASHLLNEELKMPSLSQLAWNYTDMGGYDNELKQYRIDHPEADPKKGGSFDNIPLDVLAPYNCGDTDAERKLRLEFEPRLEEQGLTYVYQNVTLPATYCVMEYQINGVALDRDLASKLSAKWRLRMEEITDICRDHKDVKKYERKLASEKREVWEAVEKVRLKEGKRDRKKPSFSHIFNPGSDKDCRGVWFDVAELTPVDLTKKRQPKVDKATREALMDEHSTVSLIHEYSTLSKLGGTYVEKMLMESERDGIFHPFYDLTGTVTGRCVSDLQQLPRATTNKDVKECIVSRFGDDGCIGELDVSQGEVRVWAICSKDETLCTAYRANPRVDMHRFSASLAFNIPEDQVSKKLRSEVKSMVTFGIMYRRGANALAADMEKADPNGNWDVDKAQKFINNYFKIFKGVWEKGQYYSEFAIQNGYLENMFGRRRRLPDAQSALDHIRQRALRQGVNFPIQSTLHDIFLYAQYQIWKQFKRRKLKSKLCGETHDGLIIDFLKSEVNEIVKLSRDIFDNLPFKWIDIPMVIDIGVGDNLSNLKDLND